VTIRLVGQAGIPGAADTTPQAVTYSSTAGNTLIVAGHFNSSGIAPFPTSITDTASNTWQVSTANAQTPPTQEDSGSGAFNTDFIAWSVRAKAVTSVTIARGDISGGGTAFWRLTVAEFSGVLQFSNSWAGLAASGTSFAVGPVTVPLPGSLAIAAVDDNSGTQTIASGWTNFTASNNNLAYFIGPPAGGSYAPSWSSTVSDFWVSAAAVFTPSVVAGQLMRSGVAVQGGRAGHLGAEHSC
jgi:hypothetical protein